MLSLLLFNKLKYKDTHIKYDLQKCKNTALRMLNFLTKKAKENLWL